MSLCNEDNDSLCCMTNKTPIVSGMAYVCWSCDEGCGSRELLRNHYMNRPHRFFEVVCAWCTPKETFRRPVYLRQHISKKHAAVRKQNGKDFPTDQEAFFLALQPRAYHNSTNTVPPQGPRTTILKEAVLANPGLGKADQWQKGWDRHLPNQSTYSPTKPAMWEVEGLSLDPEGGKIVIAGGAGETLRVTVECKDARARERLCRLMQTIRPGIPQPDSWTISDRGDVNRILSTVGLSGMRAIRVESNAWADGPNPAKRRRQEGGLPSPLTPLPSPAFNVEVEDEASLPEESATGRREEQKEDVNREEQMEDATRQEQMEDATREKRKEDATREEQREDATREKRKEDATREEQREDATREEQREDATREERKEDATREEQREDATREEQKEDANRKEQKEDANQEGRKEDANREEQQEDPRREEVAENDEHEGAEDTKKAQTETEAPPITELMQRAGNLLLAGGLPLFPPARRAWSGGDRINLPLADGLSVWPPAGWPEMSPDSKLLVWETVATSLALKFGMPLNRSLIQDAFQFLALPGSRTSELTCPEGLMRHANFRVLRQIYQGKEIVGATTIIEMMETAYMNSTSCQPGPYQDLLVAACTIPLRI